MTSITTVTLKEMLCTFEMPALLTKQQYDALRGTAGSLVYLDKALCKLVLIVQLLSNGDKKLHLKVH